MKRVQILLRLTEFLLCIILFSYFEEIFWGFSLLPHFRFQYLIISLCLMSLHCILKKNKKKKIYVFLLAISVLVQGVEIISNASFNKKEKCSGENELVILLWNTWQENENFKEVSDLIKAVNPHIVILQESHQVIITKSKQLTSHYFYSAGDNLFLLKKNENIYVELFNELTIGTLKGGNLVFKWNGQSVALKGVHLSAPTSSKRIKQRESQLADLVSLIQEEKLPQILIGDLNTTPWSREYKNISNLLEDSSNGYRVQTTWPFHNLITSFFRIPLDHCFHSKTIITCKRYVGDSKESNHRPLIVTFHI